MNKLGLLLIAIMITSCVDQEVDKSSTSYFDLEVFVDELAESAKVKNTVTKTVKLNDAEEVKEIDIYEISQELEMMKKYNINKASLSGKYNVEESGQTSIYTAIEDDLITRELTIERNNNEVKKIEIKGLQKSILSETKQYILFIPEKSFQLISEDKNKYNKDLKKEILIEY